MTKLIKRPGAERTGDISTDMADIGGPGYYIGGRSYRPDPSVSDSPVGPVAPAGSAAADQSAILKSVSSLEASIASNFQTGEKAQPFALPCITDEKLLILMAQNSVNGRLAALRAADSPLAAPIDDEPAAVPIAVGGTVTGVIDAAGDTDDVTVTLVAGQRYMISLMGSGTNALKDPYLEIFDPSLVAVGHDDDGGIDRNSVITITAAVSGTYTIRASAFGSSSGQGVGQYAVDVRQMGTDSVPATIGGAVPIAQGITFGFRETAISSGDDSDYYKVSLVAGKIYSFSVAAGTDYESTFSPIAAGEIDTLLYLRRPDGAVLALDDDISWPSDASSSFEFQATTTGDYYLEVTGYSGSGGGNTGGYVIDFHELAPPDPLDSIDWVDAANIPTVIVNGVPTAYVYFAAAGENFGENALPGDPSQPASGSNGTLVSYGWTAYEKAQFMLAMQEYTKILGIAYVETTNSAQAVFRVITNSSYSYGAYAYPQDPDYGTQKGIMVFNVDNRGWDLDSPDPAVTTDGLGRGGFAWAVILHEAGHAHGLAHPHDTGGGSTVMTGVTGPYSLGVFNLNQQIYTQMSYNDGWQTHPDGSVSGGDPNGWRADAGWLATMGAFDIAVLQARYGAAPAHATGDNVYTLQNLNGEGTYFETIYDTGGIDTIVYNGARGAQIDLNTATLDHSVTGGGIVSFVHNHPGETTAQAIKGGFTIANGVVIENATGGNGNDVLIGNGAANVLTGGMGNDVLKGGSGNDTLVGGDGIDTALIGAGAAFTPTVPGWTVTSADGSDILAGVEIVQTAGANTLLVGSGGFGTIQAAVNSARDGDTILVAAGTYTEQVVVNGFVNLTIKAAPGSAVTIEAPADVHETALSSAGREIHAVVTVIGSTNVRIENIDVDGRGVGNTVDEGTGAGAANFFGIYYRNSSGGLVDVDVTGTRDPYAAGTTPAGHPVVGSDRRGVGVGTDNDIGLLYFTMTGGSISDFQTDGATFRRSDLTITGVTVTGSGAQSTGQNGFLVTNSTGTIANNVIGAIGRTSPPFNIYSGLITVSGDAGLHITGNHLTGANLDDASAKVIGIFYSNTNAYGSITGNTISQVDIGIYLYSNFNGPMPIENNVVTNIDGTNTTPFGVELDVRIPELTTPLDIDGTAANDSIAAGAGDDHLSGLGGDDLLTGRGGSDLLEGGGGADRIDGGEGGDTLRGEAGDDILIGGAGDDDYAGGDGVDTLDFSGESGPVAVNLQTTSGYFAPNYPNLTRSLYASEALDSFGNYEALSGVENLILTTANDDASGSEAANRIDGGAGNDLILGRGGDDVLLGGAGGDSLYGQEGGDRLEGGHGDDFLEGYFGDDRLEGGDGHDILYADQGDDILSGGAGNEILMGGSGVDSFDGGADWDLISFYEVQATQGVVADLRTGIISNDGFGNVETMTGIEALERGTAFADIFYGNDEANALTIELGDFAYGFGGNDQISVGAAPAVVDGGAGNDYLVATASGGFFLPDSNGDGYAERSPAMTTGWKIDLFVGTIRDGFGNSGTVTGIENVYGTAYADDLRGDAGDNLLYGAAGNDIIRLQDGGNDTGLGSDGSDVFLFGSMLDGLDGVDGGGGTDQIALQGDYAGAKALTLGSNVVSIENLALLPGNDIRFGDPGTNFYDYSITVLDSAVAAGVQMVVDANRLRVGEDFTFNGSSETDGSFFIYGGAGVDLLTGGAKNDVFLFGAWDQFGASDVLVGGAGIDQLALRGNYSLTFGAGQLVGIENIGLLSAHDTRFGALGSSYSYDLTMVDSNVAAGVQMVVDGAKLRIAETFRFDGTAETDGSFRVFGGLGDDVITGGQNADLLQGNGGADSLTGGAGADVFRYLSASDSRSSAMDRILDFAAGSDKIDLSRIDADSSAAGDQAFSWIGSNAFSGSAGQLRAYQDGSSWFVEGDIDGDGMADFVVGVTPQGATPLGTGDFVL